MSQAPDFNAAMALRRRIGFTLIFLSVGLPEHEPPGLGGQPVEPTPRARSRGRGSVDGSGVIFDRARRGAPTISRSLGPRTPAYSSPSQPEPGL